MVRRFGSIGVARKEVGIELTNNFSIDWRFENIDFLEFHLKNEKFLIKYQMFKNKNKIFLKGYKHLLRIFLKQ